MQRLIRTGSVALLFWTFLGTLHGGVSWRISVKVLLGSQSQRPGITPVTDQEIQTQVDFANTNRFLAGRGIQLNLTEIREIPKQASESRNWFGADFYDYKNDFEAEAKSMRPIYGETTRLISISTMGLPAASVRSRRSWETRLLRVVLIR